MIARIVGSLSSKRTELLLILVVFVLIVSALYCFSFSDSRAVLAFGFISVSAAALFYVGMLFLESKGKLKPEILFVAALVLCGLFFSIVFTPGAVPDEQYHYLASYKLSDILLFLNSPSDSILMRSEDATLVNRMGEHFFLDYENYSDLKNGFSFLAVDAGTISVAADSSLIGGANPFYIKIPSALGISIGRLLNLGAYPTFYLGRMLNFALFVFLAYQAVRLTPIGKKIFIAIGLLPITVHITSSYSYDAGIIGLSFLLAALCLKAYFDDQKLSVRYQVVFIAVAAMLAPCKIIYSAIALLVLFVPNSRFVSKKSARVFKASLFACMLLAIVAFRLSTLFDMAGLSGSDASYSDVGGVSNESVSSSSDQCADELGAEVVVGEVNGKTITQDLAVRGTEAAVYWGLGGILGDPLNAILMFVRSLDQMGSHYFESMVGISLGWFQPQIRMPQYFEIILYFILGIAALRSADDSRTVPRSIRVVSVSIFAICMLAAMMSMYMAWTLVGETVIQGVQGRYFLPALPLLLLACRSKHLEITASITPWVVYLLVAINMLYVMRIFALAVGIPNAGI